MNVSSPQEAWEELILAELQRQADEGDGWHSPWVSDAFTPKGFVQIDGDVELAPLARVIAAAALEQAAAGIEKHAAYVKQHEPDSKFLVGLETAVSLLRSGDL